MLAFVAWTTWALGGCVYRFTNLATRPPAGVQSVAVEAVYDTSREVIPHEILWESLQRAFAENGRLYLTPADEADALIRVHVSNASILPWGNVTGGGVGKNKDPDMSNGKRPAPTEFMDISKASEYTTAQALNMVILVEVINLKTREVIKTVRYNETTSFNTYRNPAYAQPSTQYLLLNEALDSHFKALSRRVANKIVTDLFL